MLLAAIQGQAVDQESIAAALSTMNVSIAKEPSESQSNQHNSHQDHSDWNVQEESEFQSNQLTSNQDASAWNVQEELEDEDLFEPDYSWKASIVSHNHSRQEQANEDPTLYRKPAEKPVTREKRPDGKL